VRDLYQRLTRDSMDAIRLVAQSQLFEQTGSFDLLVTFKLEEMSIRLSDEISAALDKYST
jgi:hypothetical protein